MTTTVRALLEQRARSLAGRDRERAALLELVAGDDALVTVGAEDRRVVLVVDTYELLGLLDGWVGATLVPALPANVRVVLAGRHPPSGAWVGRYGELLATVPVHNLAAADAEDVLRRAGVDPAVNRIARGHPLALQLAATGRPECAAAPPEDAAIDAIVGELGRLYLDRLDEPTRRALAAASVTRRTTLSLLEAMLPEDSPWEAFDRLRRLPFVALGSDGLVVHDTMHAVTAALLRAADPATHRRYRLAAWKRLRSELREAPRSELWRCTADLLFLVDDPLVRQFFFPAMVLDRSTEPARSADWEAVAALAARDPDLDLGLLEDWWDAVPGGFVVVRDRQGGVTGFRCMAERDEVPVAIARRDPVLGRWREHLRRDPVPRGGRVAFVRWSAIAEDPRAPSSTQAALILEVKRTFLAMRPDLRRTYAPLPLWNGAEGACALAFGYAPVPGEPGDLPARERSLYNDYGPGSIDGWLADLAARALDVEDDTTVDAVRRELRLDGARVDLTQLEFDVLRYLQQREGRAVAREALLRDVWGYEWTGGSNVVEVAISGLRRKLGPHAAALRTVRGVGYRLEPLA